MFFPAVLLPAGIFFAMKLILADIEVPCGKLLLGEIDGALCVSDWIDTGHHLITLARLRRHVRIDAEMYGGSPVICAAVDQFNEYFRGARQDFDLPIMLAGTAFQCRVWREIMEIPRGAVISYSELAKRVGMPRAVRAVASAVGANPLPIIIPCHRVTTAVGGHSGYSGGLVCKHFLLDFEKMYQKTQL